MAISDSVKSKREPCPVCGMLLKEETRFCPNCTFDIQKSASISQHSIKSLKSLAGLNMWKKPAGQIALCALIDDLQSGLFNLKKGLVVRPGTRAILVKDGQPEVLSPGNYSISNLGLNAGIPSKIANYFKGTSHCEIYLVDDGEFKVSMGRNAFGDEEDDNELLNRVVKNLNIDELTDELIERVFSNFTDESKKTIQTELEKTFKESFKEILGKNAKFQDSFDRHGYYEKFDYIHYYRTFARSLKNKEGIKDDDIDRLEKYLLSRQAKLIRLGERWISEALESVGLLKLKTKEAFEVELSVDLYFRINGNLEFVNNVLRGRTVFRELDLIEKIHGSLQNVLQVVVSTIPIDKLKYGGSMEIRDKIREAIVSNLVETLYNWGLEIRRVEGFKWNLGPYEQLLKERANRQLEQQEEEIEKERIHDEQQLNIYKLRQEAERKATEHRLDKEQKERDNELEILKIKQQEHEKDISHESQLKRDRLDRGKQIGILQETNELQHEQRIKQFELYDRYMRSQHEREVERIRIENEIRLQRIQLLVNMSPEQIIALAAEQNPQLVSALQAYASASANKQQLAIMLEFQKQLQQVYGMNQQSMQHALDDLSNVASAKMRASQAQVIPNAGMLALVGSGSESQNLHTSNATSSGSGKTFCSHCNQIIPPPPPADKICSKCREKEDSH